MTVKERMPNLAVVYQNYGNFEDKYLVLGQDTVSLTDDLYNATLFTSMSALAKAVTMAAQHPDLNIIARKIIVYEVKLLGRTLARAV